MDGFRFDTGPSWYPKPDAFDHFFALFGKRTEVVLDLKPLTPAYRLFPEGETPIDVHSGRDNAIRLFESIEPGAGDALADYLDHAAETYLFLADPLGEDPGPVAQDGAVFGGVDAGVRR